MYKLFIFLSFFSFSFNSAASDCIKVRTAFDIGSGTTKMKVGKVDTCKQKVISILFEKSLPVSYKQSLQDSNNNTIDSKVYDEGYSVLERLKKQSLKFKPSGFFAVATSAFRTATNLEAFRKKVKENLAIDIKVITQKEEAILGFVAASNLTTKAMKDVIVWDIGGGSMQITSYDGKNFEIYEGKHAAVTFKDYVIQNIQKKDPKIVKTPNPIKVINSMKALEKASEFALSEVSESLKVKLRSGIEVLGIGGLHYYSIRGQTGKNDTYTDNDVLKALKSNSGLKDSEISDKYPKTQITNLALVGGFMQGLKIKKVRTGRVNLANGLLIKPEI